MGSQGSTKVYELSFPTTSWPVGIDIAIGFCGLASTAKVLIHRFIPKLSQIWVFWQSLIWLYIISAGEILWGFFQFIVPLSYIETHGFGVPKRAMVLAMVTSRKWERGLHLWPGLDGVPPGAAGVLVNPLPMGVLVDDPWIYHGLYHMDPYGGFQNRGTPKSSISRWDFPKTIFRGTNNHWGTFFF